MHEEDLFYLRSVVTEDGESGWATNSVGECGRGRDTEFLSAQFWPMRTRSQAH